MTDMTKLQYGVIPTDADRAPNAEPLASRSQAIPSDLGPLLGTDGQLRVLGNLTRSALFNNSTPTLHPERNRRLTQQRLVVGGEVWAEGTQGEVTGSLTFDTGGITVTGFPTTLRLVLTGGPSNAILGSFRVVSLLGTTITVASAMVVATGYTWQLVSLAPVQLLPMPAKTGFPGSETTYLTVLPSKWPVGLDATRIPIIPTTFNGTLTALPNGRLQFSGTHLSPSALNQIDDVVFLGSPSTSTRAGVRARVDAVSFTPGAPSSEVLTLEPLFGEEVLDYTAATQATRLAQVEDFTLDPYDLIQERSIYNNTAFLEAVRVYPLVSPSNGPVTSLQSSAATVLGQGDLPFVNDRTAGYALVLYPADVSGNPDLTKPVTNFDSVIINPAIAEPQSVFVDYAQGAVILSHPIPESGDLNPNGYVAADGTKRLFAVFVAYNRSYAPESVKALKGDGPLTGTSLAFEPADTVYPLAEPVNRVPAWVLRPDHLQDYHVDLTTSSATSPAVAVTSSNAGLINTSSPQILMQRRSQRIPVTNIGGIFYGPSYAGGIGNPSSSPQQVAIYPSAVSETVNVAAGTPAALDTLSSPHIGFSEGWKDLEFTVPFLVVMGATGVQLFVNDLEVSFNLPIGAYNATSFQALLSGSIVAAGLAAGAEQESGRDFYVVISPITNRVILHARDQLITGTGTAHASLGIVSNRRILGQGIFERVFAGQFSGVTRTAAWDYNLRGNDALNVTWRGTDVNIDQGPSLLGVGESFEASYSDLVVSSNGPTTYIGDVVNTQDFRAYVRIQEYGLDVVRYQQIRGASLPLTGLGSGIYLIYWDRFQRDYVTILDALVADKTLQTGLYQGLPIAKVTFDGVNITDLQSYMSYTYNRKYNDILTVGVGGMFETIQAACYWIEINNPVTKTIHLVSDITADALYGGDAYVPSGVTIDGNGYTVTIANYVAPIAKPLFHLRPLDTDVASRGITIRNMRIVFDNLANQILTSLVLDDSSNPPVSDTDPSITLDGIYYYGDAGGGTNVVATVVLAQHVMDLTVRDCYFDDLDITLNAFQGCRRYYVENCDFSSVRGNNLGTSSLFGLSISDRLFVRNVSYNTISTLTELCAFVRNATGEVTSGCTIDLENVRAQMNFSDFMLLDNSTVTARTDLAMKDCRITTENENQQYIAGITRRVNAKIQNCEFLRLAASGTAPSEGFLIGDATGGGQASFWLWDGCLIDGARFTASSYDGVKVQISNSVMTGQSNVLANNDSGTGLFELIDNTWTEGVLSFSEWRVGMRGGRYVVTSTVVAPQVQFSECDVNVGGGIRFLKTSTDTNPVIRLRLASSVDMSDIEIQHGNGLTGSPTAIQINGDASFTRFSVSNIGLTYLGTATGAAAFGFTFLATGSPVQASFTLVGFIFRDYPNVATASTAMSFTANWSLFTIASGFTISGTAGLTTFLGSGTPTEFYLETSARFTP